MTPPWTLEDGTEFIPTEEDFGFIYQIDYDDGTSYVGKKNLWIEEELPPLKSGKPRENAYATVNRNKNGKRITMDVVRKPSNWRSYTGSSALTKNKTIIRRTVLATADSKRYLTYLEVKALFCLDAIEDPKFINENIQGRFFRDNLI